jgi:hypothetical protein
MHLAKLISSCWLCSLIEDATVPTHAPEQPTSQHAEEWGTEVLIGALCRTTYARPRPPPDSVYEDIEGGGFEAQWQARARTPKRAAYASR